MSSIYDLMSQDKVTFLIPARRDSEGLEYKNRFLFHHTLKNIPELYRQHIVVNTNDEEVIKMCSKEGIDYYRRLSDLAKSTTSTKEVMEDFVYYNHFTGDHLIVLLYLTYPTRKFEHIIEGYEFMKKRNAASMLCKKKIQNHPYLCLIDQPGDKGIPATRPHDLYRRQDYPPCFQLSHYVSMFYAAEVRNLNNNLYNDDTVYMPVDNIVDVDTMSDLLRLGT